MKIRLNIDEFYRLMRERNIETVSQLSKESDISCERLYMALRKKTMSKENYWLLARFYGCHVEDLQILDDTL